MLVTSNLLFIYWVEHLLEFATIYGTCIFPVVNLQSISQTNDFVYYVVDIHNASNKKIEWRMRLLFTGHYLYIYLINSSLNHHLLVVVVILVHVFI